MQGGEGVFQLQDSIMRKSGESESSTVGSRGGGGGVTVISVRCTKYRKRKFRISLREDTVILTIMMEQSDRYLGWSKATDYYDGAK